MRLEEYIQSNWISVIDDTDKQIFIPKHVNDKEKTIAMSFENGNVFIGVVSRFIGRLSDNLDIDSNLLPDEWKEYKDVYVPYIFKKVDYKILLNCILKN